MPIEAVTELARSQVPDLGRPVDRAGGEHTAIGRERHGRHGAGMPGQRGPRRARRDVPDHGRRIPAPRSQRLAIAREGQASDRSVVALQDETLLAGGEVPEADDLAIAARGQSRAVGADRQRADRTVGIAELTKLVPVGHIPKDDGRHLRRTSRSPCHREVREGDPLVLRRSVTGGGSWAATRPSCTWGISDEQQRQHRGRAGRSHARVPRRPERPPEADHRWAVPHFDDQPHRDDSIAATGELDRRRGDERLEEALDLEALPGRELEELLRRGRTLAPVQGDRLLQGLRATVVEVRARVAESPERRRPPFLLWSRP